MITHLKTIFSNRFYSFFILAVVLGIFWNQAYNRFQQKYEYQIQSAYLLIVEELQEGIEKNLDFKKSLQTFTQQPTQFNYYDKVLPFIQAIHLYDQTHQIIMSSRPASIGEYFKPEWFETCQATPLKECIVSKDKTTALSKELKNNLGDTMGGLVLTFAHDQYHKNAYKVLHTDFVFFIMSLLLLWIMITVIYELVLHHRLKHHTSFSLFLSKWDHFVMHQKKGALLCIGLSVILVFMVFLYLHQGITKQYHREATYQKADIAATIMAQQISHVLEYGFDLRKIPDIPLQMQNFLALYPEIDQLVLTDFEGHLLFSTYQTAKIDFQKPILAGGHAIGWIKVGVAD